MAATGVVGAAVGAVAGNYYGTQTTVTQAESLKAELENLKKKIPVQPEGEVRVYTWSEYIAEHLIDVFKMNTGINVVYDTYESTDEMRAKVSPGHSGYDVVMITDYMIPEFVELGLLAELDLTLLPNVIHWMTSSRILTTIPATSTPCHTCGEQLGSAGTQRRSIVSQVGQISSNLQKCRNTTRQ